jgi:hypothetical protein
MSQSPRSLTLRSACAALALLGLLAALAGPALAATVVHFQHESYAALLAQVRKGEVHAVVLHPSGPKAHAALNDGGHVSAVYPPSEASKLGAEVRAHGGAFAIATSKPKAPAHHKLRYIAGGILIVVIVVVLTVLLIGRRRAIADEEELPRGGEAA